MEDEKAVGVVQEEDATLGQSAAGGGIGRRITVTKSVRKKAEPQRGGGVLEVVVEASADDLGKGGYRESGWVPGGTNCQLGVRTI